MSVYRVEHQKHWLEQRLSLAGRARWRLYARQELGRAVRQSLWNTTVTLPIAAVATSIVSHGWLVASVTLGVSAVPVFRAMARLIDWETPAATARWVDTLNGRHNAVSAAFELCRLDDASPFAQAAIADGLWAIENAALPTVTMWPAASRLVKPSALLAIELTAIAFVSLAAPRQGLARLTCPEPTINPALTIALPSSTTLLPQQQSAGRPKSEGHGSPTVSSSDNSSNHSIAISNKPTSSDTTAAGLGMPSANAPGTTERDLSANNKPQMLTNPPQTSASPASANKSETKADAGGSSAPPPQDGQRQEQRQAAPPPDSTAADEPPPERGTSNDSPPPPQPQNQPNDHGQASGSALPKKSRGVAPLLLETRQPDLFEGRRLPGQAERWTLAGESSAASVTTGAAAGMARPSPSGPERPISRYAVPAEQQDDVTRYFQIYRQNLEHH